MSPFWRLDSNFTLDVHFLLLHLDGVKIHYREKDHSKMLSALNDAISKNEKLLSSLPKRVV